MITWLVDLTILKNMSSSMGRMTSHILWKIKIMFETTNQSLFVEPAMHSPKFIVASLPGGLSLTQGQQGEGCGLVSHLLNPNESPNGNANTMPIPAFQVPKSAGKSKTFHLGMDHGLMDGLMDKSPLFPTSL